MFIPLYVSCVTCHMSHVTCHVARVTCFFVCVFFLSFKKIDNVVELGGRGSVINGAYPVYVFKHHIYPLFPLITKCVRRIGVLRADKLFLDMLSLLESLKLNNFLPKNRPWCSISSVPSSGGW